MYHTGLLRYLEQWGLMDFVLPVLLIFTTAFGILQKLPIFKEGEKKDKPNTKVNMVLALGIALAATVPHITGQGPDVVAMIAKLLPNSFLILMAFILSLLLLSLISEPISSPLKNFVTGGLATLALVTLVITILQAGGIVTFPFLNFILDPNTLSLLIIILVFVLVVYFIQKKELTPDEKKAAKDASLKDWKDTLGKIFG